MKTASYTDLRNNLKNYLDAVIDDSEPLIIHRQKGNGVVVISLDEYNSLKETEYIKSSPEMIKRINEAETAIHSGKGKKISLDDLWK